ALPRDRPRFTKRRLVRAVRTLVREGMAEARLLGSAPKLGRQVSPANKRAMELASSFISGKPNATLAEVGRELARVGVLPFSGRPWAPSSLKALVDRARLRRDSPGRRPTIIASGQDPG